MVRSLHLILAAAAAFLLLFLFVHNASADGRYLAEVTVDGTACVDPMDPTNSDKSVVLALGTQVSAFPIVHPAAPDMKMVDIGGGYTCLVDPAAIKAVVLEPEPTIAPIETEVSPEETVIPEETAPVIEPTIEWVETAEPETVQPEAPEATVEPVSVVITTVAIDDAPAVSTAHITALPNTGSGTSAQSDTGLHVLGRYFMEAALLLLCLGVAVTFLLVTLGILPARIREFGGKDRRHARHCIPRGPH